MSRYHERYGLTPIINTAGTQTTLGASSIPPEVVERVVEAAPEFARMTELLAAADAAIAHATGAEAGTVTHCAASAIAVLCAGAMTGTHLGKVLALPDTSRMQNELIIQKRHTVGFGAPVTQMIRLSGARAVEFGEANRALPEQMEYAITEETAAALYVISHMTATSGQLSLPAFAEIAHRHNIPVIVDAAAGAFFAHRLLAEGADAVCFSGHKHLCGFTSGVIAGKRDLVAAAAMNGKGIGRAMKPSKEGVVSVIERMEWLADLDYAAWESGQNAKVDVMVAALQGIPGVNVFAERDVTGNPQTRTKIVVDPEIAGMDAVAVCKALEDGSPPIYTRDHYAEEGFLFIDPITLRSEDVPTVIARLQEVLQPVGAAAG